tara:strand:- start:6814 stop:7248 length:435 start_codon:yes stop_codon:yes gene_type:complete
MPQIKLNLSVDQIENILTQLRYGKYTAENFDIDLLRGLNGEVEALQTLTGKLEVKTDFKAYKTGNIAIEVECNGKPSGISTTEADWWLFNIRIPKGESMMLIISASRLTKLAQMHLHMGHFVMAGDRNASKCVLVPIEQVICGG